MIPFLGMGTDQLAESKVGEPRTGDSVKFEGEDGFQTRWKGSKVMQEHFLNLSPQLRSLRPPYAKRKKKLVRHEHTVPLIKCITWRQFTGLSRVVYQATKAMAI